MPQVTARELSAFLLANRFDVDRQTGSHLHLRHQSGSPVVTIPMHSGRDLGRGLAQSILR
jgi:predicted RNA binding protein YcfA (HicA-like mRNA interferase family)